MKTLLLILTLSTMLMTSCADAPETVAPEVEPETTVEVVEPVAVTPDSTYFVPTEVKE